MMDDGLAPWELPDPYFHKDQHASYCSCEVCTEEEDRLYEE